MKLKKILLIGLVLGLGVACTEDDVIFQPINQITTAEILGSAELLEDVTQGNYSFLKSVTSERSYMRLRNDIKSLMSDDIIMMRWSGNNFSYTLSYNPQAESSINRNFWQLSYKGISAVNVVLDVLNKKTEALTDHEKNLYGENQFIRAMFTFDLVTVFARPYSHDNPATNLGVILVTDPANAQDLSRSTVKEVYDFLEQEFLSAADLMRESRPNIYASKEVAYAALARLYLYMEQNEKAVEYADKVINSGRYALVSSQQFPTSNELGPEANPETIFAIKLHSSENQGNGSIGTMYHGDGGWGEILLSSSYLDLLNKYRDDDLRWNFVDPDFKLDADGNKIPDPDEPYYGYAMNDRMGLLSYWSDKLTYENGEAMLYSPRYFRLAEMYLIKAEAFAKTNQDQKALDMVNIIRERAGLSGDQLFRLDNMQGYGSILDIVLDEKRLEFVLEPHRSFDVFRNKRTMDRSYSAYQGWSGPAYIPYTSNRIVHQIPQVEINQNPNLEQNPGWN